MKYQITYSCHLQQKNHCKSTGNNHSVRLLASKLPRSRNIYLGLASASCSVVGIVLRVHYCRTVYQSCLQEIMSSSPNVKRSKGCTFCATVTTHASYNTALLQ